MSVRRAIQRPSSGHKNMVYENSSDAVRCDTYGTQIQVQDEGRNPGGTSAALRRVPRRRERLGARRGAILRRARRLPADRERRGGSFSLNSAIQNLPSDARQFTREATIEALESAFPLKKLRSEKHSRPDFTQTALFDSELEAKGEIDFVMW